MTASLTGSLRETLACFGRDGVPMTTTEVAARLDLGRRSTYDRLDRLVDHGRLETKKVGANARVWWRPPDRPTATGSLVDDVFDDADVGVLVLDEAFEVVWTNETVGRYFGFDRDRVLGRDGRTVVDETLAPAVEDPSAFAERTRPADDDTAAERFECRVTPGDGREERWLERRSEPVASGPYAGGRVDLYYDVTERERERRHAAAHEQFESLVEAVEEYAVFLLDADGRVRTWNPGAARIEGYDADEVLGEHVSTFYTEADRAADVPEQDLAAAAEAGEIEREGWRVRADGSRFRANVTITAIRGEDGDLEGYAKVTRDMTERREYERRLRTDRGDLADELAAVFDRIDDAFFALDDEWRFTHVNDRAETLLGRSAAALVGRSVWDEFPEAIGSRFQDRYERARETGESVTFEEYYEPLDAWFDVAAYPDEDGLSVYFRDVTDRKERERELEESRGRYRTLVEHFPNGAVTLVDDDLRYVTVGGDPLDEADATAEDLEGRRVREVLPPGLADLLAPRYETALAGERHAFEARVGDRHYQFRILPVRDDDGEVFAAMGMSQDVTERKEYERELEQYRALTQAARDVIVTIDGASTIRSVNPAVEDVFGHAPDELEGESLTALMPEAFRERHLTAMQEYLASGQKHLDWDYVELRGRRASGDEFPVALSFSEATFDGDRFFTGIVRDISERKRRERELQDRIDQQEVVSTLAQRALEDRDLDALLAEAAELVAATLDTDYCEVLDLDADAGELLLRQGVGWDEGVVGEATVAAVDSQAAYTLRTDRPVVVTDLDAETRFGGPDLLADHDVTSGVSTIIGPPDDPWGVLGTHDTARTEFSEHDVTFVQSVATILATAIERHRHERELVDQRERVAALNHLNGVVREITDAVIDQSTRAEIEETVCEHLVDSESYLLAWIGEVDPASQRVRPRTAAGVEGYLDDLVISVDPDDERSEGPTGLAVRTGEVRTARDIDTNPGHDPWRSHVDGYGFRSSAAIPIVHEDTVYGVLNVYADRPGAFEGQERAVVSQLGEVVGHAIAAAERKRALMGDELIELEFLIPDAFDGPGADGGTGGTVTFDHVVPVADGEYLVYGTATADATGDVRAFVETVPHWVDVTVRDEGGDGEEDGERRFEARLSEPPVLSALASVGGSVERAVVEDGDCRMTIDLSPTVDVRRVIDAVKDAYPTTRLLKRRQVGRESESSDAVGRVLTDDLTDRQRTALEAAYHAGFFEWPRDASGEEVAASLEVAPPTFHQHLRKAERKVFDRVFSGSTVSITGNRG